MTASASAPEQATMNVTTSGADLSRLFDAQRQAFADQPPRYEQRIEALRSLERALVSRRDEISAAIAADFGGRPAEETLALELVPLVNEIRHARRHLRKWMRPRRAAVQWPFFPATAAVHHQPLGVVGVLSPWNYPFFLTLGPLVGILAAGNHALLKPSELAPASAALLQALLADLFPERYVAVVTGGADVATALTRLPLDHLVFTGSTRVGVQVMAAASRQLTPVTLELGGKSPAIVHASYPLDTAAARIMAGKLYNAGQTCVAPDYVLVPEGRGAEFVAAARRAIARMFPEGVHHRDYTRIISARHHRRLTDLLDDAQRLGATIERFPAAGPDDGSRVFAPALVTRVSDAMAIMEEEIFGPILPIVEYRSLDLAIDDLNARPHPLAAYYFDNDRQRTAAVVDRLIAGGVTVNDCVFHVGQTRLPFGGVGASGMGRYHGVYGFETFSHRKGVLYQRRWSSVALLRPPYRERARALLRLLLRG